MIFVIAGNMIVESDSRFYPLRKDDVLVLNRNEVYQLSGEDDNVVLMLTIKDSFINRYYPAYHGHPFRCYSREVEMGRDLIIDRNRKLLAEMMISYLRKNEGYQLEIQRSLCQILLNLIRNFSVEGTTIEKFETDDQRITEIVHYIERNYEQPITLEEVADQAHLSPTYLSRYFKQKVGIGFSRFLMNTRLKHSVKSLVYTNDSISQIALKNGFPNTKSFTNLFKELYGVTPHEYRDNHVVEGQMDSVHTYNLRDSELVMRSPEILSELARLLATGDTTYVSMETRSEGLTIEPKTDNVFRIDLPGNILIIRELNELLKEDVRSQVLMVKEELGLRFISISRLSGAAILPSVETDERIPTTSPYFNTDIALSYMQKNNLSLFIRAEYKEISEDDGYFDKLTSFLKHCLQIYGEKYLASWHVIFYEPSYTATADGALRRTYVRLHTLLKGLVPGISVGVLLPFSFQEGNVPKPHRWQLAEGNRIDFIGYQANQNEVINFAELGDDRYDLAKNYILEKTKRVKDFLKQHQIDKPLYLVSWNTLSGNTRLTNGTFFRGALVLKNALDLAGYIAAMAFWINTEKHEEDKQNLRLRMEGLELFHYFRGKRPAYYAMLFAKKLQGVVVARGEDYLMTQTDRGYQLILMNCNYVNPYYSIEEAFLQRLNKTIRVTIIGIPTGDYQIRKYIFDKDNGALYTNWWKLSSQHGMDAEIIDYITRASYPSLELFDERIDGDWVFYSDMTTNAIHYFEIRKSI